MENSNRFDLNAALCQWRENLGRSPSLGSDDLEEMESHLREATAGLARQGLSEEEAFLVSLRRLGGTTVLEPEFAKVNGGPWLHRLLWMLLGIQAWQVLSSAAGLCAGVAGGLVGYFGSAPAGIGFQMANAVLPAGLQVFVYVAILALFLWACWRAVGQNGAGLSTLATRFFRRPALAVCAIPALLLVFALARQLEVVWLARQLGLPKVGLVFVAQNLAGVVTLSLQTIGVAVLTFMVARRRLGITAKVGVLAKP